MLKMENSSSMNSSKKNIELPANMRRPQYNGLAFSRIPAAIESLFSDNSNSEPGNNLASVLEARKKVVFILVDALGYSLIERHRERSSFLESLLSDNAFLKISSQFPSTTAAHVTTLNTGREVGQHGVYEWTYYEERLDEVISALMFSYGDDAVGNNNKSETLRANGILPERILPEGAFHERLETSGVLGAYFCPSDFIDSSYNQRLCEHMTALPYKGLRSGLDSLVELVNQISTPSYISFYYPGIDSVGHDFGPSSKETIKEFDEFLSALEAFLVKLRTTAKDTLVIITADHGQIDVDPTETIYLDERVPGLSKYLLQNKKGRLLVPCGGERDLFLHVMPECLDLAHEKVSLELKDEALVFKTKDFIEAGFFGMYPCEEVFLKNVGNLLVLPLLNQAVGWRAKGRYESNHRGIHGGLDAQEMEIPFIVVL